MDFYPWSIIFFIMLRNIFYIIFLVFTLSSCTIATGKNQEDYNVDRYAGQLIDEVLVYDEDPSDFLFRLSNENEDYPRQILIDIEKVIQSICMHTDPKDLTSDDIEYQYIVEKAQYYAYYKLYMKACGPGQTP